MRLALADVKKTIHRRDGTVYVAPYLLRPRERERELASLIALFEGAVDRPRSAFPADLPGEIIGDYRLARCLILCLSEWYAWQAPDWSSSATPDEIVALGERGIASPTQLRLALYDAVSTRGGYLAEDEREQAMTEIAAGLGVSLSTLERLLYLDAEENAKLVRISEQTPASGELRSRYNQRAFEALLSSAASVELLLPPATEAGEDTARGARVKRICFLAKRLGVQYDLAFEGSGRESASDDGVDTRRVAETPAGYLAAAAARPLDDVSEHALVVTLFGPQELVGSPAQYGERLAAVCRSLLGYRATDSASVHPTSESLRGYARVYLHGRPLIFSMDDRVLRLVRGGKHEPLPDGVSNPSFDSEPERRLHEEFSAYEQAGEAHGWRLEREPEPIIVGDTIMIPDFALTRGARRVYLEIAGYWRPEYRERKLRKLRALRGAVSLIVAVPEAARAEYEALASDFPLLWYRTYLGARPLLELMDRAFDDLEQRLASVDFRSLLNTAAERLLIPEREALVLLRVYSRNERAAAMARLRESASAAGQALEWVEGVGLCLQPWLETVVVWLRERVTRAEGSQLALPALAAELCAAFTLLGATDTTGVESLVRRAGLNLARPSLFEAIVTLDGGVSGADSPPEALLSAHSTQPRRGVRRKHHDEPYATHSLFEPETANPDSSPPVAPRPKIP